MRPLDAHGKWQGKTQKEYLCRKADEERGFTAQEFLQAKEDGWEKQYKYRSAAGVSAWLTPTQAAREPGWERCSKQPKAANSGDKTRCVRVGTARSNCWIGEKHGQMP